MRRISEAETRDALAWPALVDALAEMFRTGCETPPRHHHSVEVPGEAAATLLLMPAWATGAHIGVKLATVFPGNAARDMPAIAGVYVLFDGANGTALAMIDGGELTARRTAAASALAARRLAREDASRMLMMGTGRLCLNLIEAHASQRPIRRVAIWGRSPEKAAARAREAAALGFEARAVEDPAEAAGEADLISCATLASDPILRGDWLSPGVHVDLVGAFKPALREADNAVMARADGVFVDTRPGAFGEGGDILQAIEAGAIPDDPVAADLFELCGGDHPGRRGDDEITVFKSVGASLEDLAGAILAYRAAGARA